ncbi:MAG: hypothetical protein H0U55_10515 [Rubrobacteraceae bacterium]|nr:hypothetical protein [Rubrobacteraceae bacterium]
MARTFRDGTLGRFLFTGKAPLLRRGFRHNNEEKGRWAMTRVSNLKARAALLVVALLATLLVLALSACGGAGGQEEQAKARSLPLYPTEKPLRPGEYHSVKFKPALSFKVGKGWSNTAEELSDFIELGYEGQTGFITFANVKEVFKPGTTNVVEAPKDLVGWLQHHPYLKTSKPEPVTLGGVRGEQLEVLVDHLPKDPNGYCGSDCLDIAPLSNDEAYFREVNKRRVIVFEDVEGDTVMIWFAAPPDEFDEFAPEAQKVIDSVKWSGS